MLRLICLGLAIPLGCSNLSATSRAAIDPRAERLCGTWRATTDDGTIVEERWRIETDRLVGEGVTTHAGAEVGRESLVILLEAESSIYRAHPQGAPAPTDFAQTEASPTDGDPWIWAWSSPSHDFPQTIRYEFTGSDRIAASISGVDETGEPRRFGWTFERVAACSD